MIVADTGPLIALARVEQLDLLTRLYTRVVIPPAVRGELAIESERSGAAVLAAALKANRIVVQSAIEPNVIAELAQDPGEAEAIALAEQQAARFLLIDDAKGRGIARQRGIPVVGVAGVLLAAKSQGALAAVGPVLTELSKCGYRLSPRLLASVLTEAHE
jgi:predicted nucleic acid-binding protein